MAHSKDRIDVIRQRMPTLVSRELAFDWPRMLVFGLNVALATTAASLIITMGAPLEHLDVVGIGALLVPVTAVMIFAVARLERFQSNYLGRRARGVIFLINLVLVLGGARIAWETRAEAPWAFLLVPLPLAALLFSVVFNRRFAFEALAILAVLLALQLLAYDHTGATTREVMGSGGILFGGAFAVTLACRTIRSRTKLVKVGLIGTVTMIAGLLMVRALGADPAAESSTGFLFALLAGNGLAAGIAGTLLIPAFEYVLGVLTEMRLLELESGNHHLLKTMLERAPGTYMHTQNVSRLASNAVEAIGGDSLLTRVGVLFHDIGKMVRPEYFTENEPNSKLFHDRLTPTMSATIIVNHVKEGVVLARQYRLPRILEDFITGHHGTSSVGYFYRMAKMRAEEGEYVEESQFRYPGPKPQTREAAVVAVADLVEAAGRAKLDGAQTPASLRKFIHESIVHKFNDGQFDECDITVRDLRVIEDSMVKTLASMYHHRVKYPDDPDARKRKLAILEKEEHRREMARRREKILTQ